MGRTEWRAFAEAAARLARESAGVLAASKEAPTHIDMSGLDGALRSFMAACGRQWAGVPGVRPSEVGRVLRDGLVVGGRYVMVGPGAGPSGSCEFEYCGEVPDPSGCRPAVFMLRWAPVLLECPWYFADAGLEARVDGSWAENAVFRTDLTDEEVARLLDGLRPDEDLAMRAEVGDE